MQIAPHTYIHRTSVFYQTKIKVKNQKTTRQNYTKYQNKKSNLEENKAITGVPAIAQPTVVAVEPAAAPAGVRHIPNAVRAPKY